MKLVVIYKESIKGKKLLPRDVRNYVASICKQDKELHDIVMSQGHHNKQPTFIFSTTNKKSFAIYTFKKDKLVEEAMKRLSVLLYQNPQIHIRGIKAVVKESFTTEYEFTKFEYGLLEREIRTPIIIAAAEYEYAICVKATKDKDGRKECDQKWLEEYTASKIKETAVLVAKDWFGEEESLKIEALLEDTIILFKDLKYTVIKYKENLYFPAVTGTIISNRKLPQFLGYKSGLGYGELSTLKVMDTVNKKKKVK